MHVTVFHYAELQCCEDYSCRLLPLGFPKDKNRKIWDLGTWEVTVLCWLFCRIADGWRNCPIGEWVITADKRRPACSLIVLLQSLLEVYWVLNSVCLLSNLLCRKNLHKMYGPPLFHKLGYTWRCENWRAMIFMTKLTDTFYVSFFFAKGSTINTRCSILNTPLTKTGAKR
jgi:hypothetical protein